MKNKLIAILAASALLLMGAGIWYWDETSIIQMPDPAFAEADIESQTNAWKGHVTAKLKTGTRAEADFVEELHEFDAIVATHKGEKTDELAKLAAMRAALFIEVFNEPEKGVVMLKQLETNYPDTATAQGIAQVISKLEAQIEARAASAAIRKSLVVGSVFPDFSVKDIDGQPLSIVKYRGNVLLVDFWATWCGPCLREMPDIIQAYNQYHNKGFEIIGVSLDREMDQAKLIDFIKQNDMPWQQFYDGKLWANELAVKYGVESIPTSYLLDREGKIIAVQPHGPALELTIENALAAK